VSDAIDDYLAALARILAVHPRRRERIMLELESHLRESAERQGAAEAIARMGTAADVARSFTPGLLDRLWQQRDRIAALCLLAALAGCLPLAADLWKANDEVGRGVALYAAFLAPATLLAVCSSVLVLLRRPAGRRLVAPLAAIVALMAVVTVLDLPPVAGAFDGYQAAVRQGYESGGCGGRSLAACATDHASEIRLNYSAGALLLTVAYAWAVAGWSPWRSLQRRGGRDDRVRAVHG
jgi:hypothetical protein